MLIKYQMFGVFIDGQMEAFSLGTYDKKMKIAYIHVEKANPEIRFTKGSTWLVYQAITGYEIFTGEKPDLEKMSTVL